MPSGATAELRELAHGNPPVGPHPRAGCARGVEELGVAQLQVPVQIDVSVGRLATAVEATAYFVVSEALTNVRQGTLAPDTPR